MFEMSVTNVANMYDEHERPSGLSTTRIMRYCLTSNEQYIHDQNKPTNNTLAYRYADITGIYL